MEQQLVQAIDVLPGDTFTESDSVTYVVYNNIELSGSVRRLQMIALEPGSRDPYPRETSLFNEDKLLVNRPSS